MQPPRIQTQSTRFSAWAWEPSLWLEQPGELLHTAQAYGVDRLYVTLLIDGEEVAQASNLRAFLGEAGGRRIEIFAVEGDPEVVFSAAGLMRASARARAIARLRDEIGSELVGVQYDVEPYAHARWRGDERQVRAWGRALRALALANSERIELVLPSWALEVSHAPVMLDELRPYLRSIVVMAYRTRLEAIVEAAKPLVMWAGVSHIPAQVALECLPSHPPEISFRGDVAEALSVARGLRAALPPRLRIALHGLDWVR
jgi:hypothetical protein